MAGNSVRGYLKNLYGGAAQSFYEGGLDPWSKRKRGLQQEQQEFDNYLNSGDYTVENNATQRSSASKRVEDLGNEMKNYSKSSDEYRTLEAYKNYYEQSLPTFDRLDVGLNANNYISSDAWHSEEDYNAQRTSLQNSIDSIQAEMDAIGDEESDDYKQLATYRDWYQKIMDGGEDGFGLAQREQHDRQFKDLDEYTQYQRAQDYGNNVQLKKTLEDVSGQFDTAKAEFKQAQIDYNLGKIGYKDLALADQKMKALEEQKNQLSDDLTSLEKIQWGTIYNNYVDQYGEDADFRPIVNSLIEDREKAKRLYGENSAEYEKIDRTIKVLAGDNEESLNDDRLVTDATLYGQSVLRDIDREDLQAQIDEIDAKLAELGAEQTTGMGWLSTLGNAAQASEAAKNGQIDQYQAAIQRIQDQNNDEVKELRAQRLNLQRLLNSSESIQKRETTKTELPKVEGYDQFVEAGKNSVQKVQNANGKEVYAYTLPGYDENAEDSVRAKYSRLLDDFEAIADKEEYQWLSDMIYAAVGAEVEGKDIGYTVQDLMDTYGGLISQVKGLEQAKRVHDIDSDFVRWNAQVLGVGTQAGLNQFVTGVQQAFSTDYIEPNSTAIMGQKVREDIGEQYGGKKFFRDSGTGGATLSQLAFDTTQTTANMLPMILASSLITGGLGAAGVAAGTAAKVGEIAGATLMGVSSAGNSYQQALAEGWDKRDARLFSTIMGTAEGGLQYLIGGISKLRGGKGLEDAALNAAKGINNGVVRWMAETGTHIASEVNEELLQNRIERVLTNYLFNGGEDSIKECLTWNDDDWYTVMVTALSTGALEGPGSAMNLTRNTRLGKQLTGEVSAMSEKEAAKIQGKIESKQAITQREANKKVLSRIGEVMKGDSALNYTLLAIGENMMYADGEAHELASRMASGKAAKSAANYGELYSLILNEFEDRNGADGYDDAMMAVIGGAIAYHKGNAAEDNVKAKQEQVAKIREANPGVKVLDENSAALKNLGAPDSSLSEYSVLVNKMLSGTRLTEAETAKLSDGSMAAKAARVYIGQQLGINLNANTTAEVTKATLDAATTDLQSTKKQQEEMRKMSVVQAAMNAADRAAVNRATANTEIGKAKWSSENQAWEGGSVVDRATDRGQSYSGWKSGQTATQERVKASDVKAIQKADAELKAAQSELDWIKRASFKELARAEFAGLGKYSEAIGAIRDLQKQLSALNDAADRINANKFPTREQRDQLADIRQQQAAIKQQIGTIGAGMEAKIKAEAAEARKAQPAAAAQGKAARNSSGTDGDTIKLPGVGEKTRAEFVQEYLEKHPDASKEQANELFEKRAAETGGYVKKGTVENEQQSTSGNEDRNDVGDAGNRPQNSLWGDQSERAGGREEAGRVVELRSRGDELVARVDETASVIDGEDLSTIIDEFSDVETLRDMLKDIGFDSIKFVVNGNMYNEAGQKIHGAMNGNELVLQLVKGRDYFGVARHEAMHLKLAQFLSHFGEQEKNAFVSGALQSLLSENAYKDIFKAYFAKYSLAYKNSTPQELAHLINEEILCDMIGGIDGFGTNTGEYQDDLANYIETSGFDVVTQNIHDGAEDVGKVLTTEEIAENKMPYGAPVDTLISSDKVDEPSTAVVSTTAATRDAQNSMAKAMGFHIDGENKVWYRTAEDAKNKTNGFKDVTYEDIENSPIGELIDYAQEMGYLSDDPAVAEAMARRQKMMFADIGTISEKTADFYMAMQFYGSAFFTAMKTNADKQYGTTYDMTSICTKTQAIINAMSKRMVDEGRGLSDEEILDLYQKEFTAGQPVSCPECYVFSRWIGIGGLLDNIKYYQDYYGAMTPEEVEQIFATQRKEIADAAEKRGVSFGKEKSKLVSQAQKKLDDLLDKQADLHRQGKELGKQDLDKLALLKENAAKLRGLTWIDKVYFGGKAHTAENVNPRFRVPDDVLFDLNRGEDFVRDYKEAWAFRTTQGAGYGKAITPTAEAHLGEGILVTKSTSYIKKKEEAARAGREVNTFYNERGPILEYREGPNGEKIPAAPKKNSRAEALQKATKKQRNQLFIGGQRLQSTSDARYDTAIDYLLVGLEMQAMHGAIQVYTKVLGAVPFFNRIGAFSNMSMMPYVGSVDENGNPLGNGIGGLDENGVPVDTAVGGIPLEVMKEYRKAFERAGSITIGINDAHIRALMAQEFRDFIIPYHASGGNSEIIAEMRRIQEGRKKGEGTSPQSSDYTLTQTDKFLSDTILKEDLGYSEEKIKRIHDFRDMRIWLLTGHRYGAEHRELLFAQEEGLSDSERNARKILQELDVAMRQGGKWEGVSLAKGTIEGQIFPNEFWDTKTVYDPNNLSKDTSHLNTQRYLDYCEALGVLHRFSGKGVKTMSVVGKDGKKQYRGAIFDVGGRNQFGQDESNGNKVYLTDLAFKNGKNGEIEPFFWKLLVDRRMYGNNGQYLEQNTISLNGLVEGEDAQAAVEKATRDITNKNVGFASPAYEGERKYNHRESMSRNRIEIKPSKTRNALAMDDPGYETSKTGPAVTDDRGQALFVEPTTKGWAVARDTDGSLLNTDYLKNELGMDIFDNPKDAYAPPEKNNKVIQPKHKTSNPSTEDTYQHFLKYVEDQNVPDDVVIVDASSGMGLGSRLLKNKFGDENVIDLEPFPGDTRRDGIQMPDYGPYGSLIYDMEDQSNDAVRKADYIISNAVINVLAQDAREEHLAALLRMLDDNGTIFINPAFASHWKIANTPISLEEYKSMREQGEDVSKKNVMLVPEGENSGQEVYVVGTKTVQKGYTEDEFKAFAKDVAKQALGIDINIVPAKGTGSFKKGFLITKAGKATPRYALSPDQQKNQDYNNKQTEIGSQLKTLQGTPIKRYKNIAGKEVSPQVYVHKDYAAQVVPENVLNRAEEVLSEKYPDFQYNTIMYDRKTGNVRFDEAPDFDTAREPIAGNTVTVTPDGETKTGYSDAIWHHKWLWVGNDYKGFDVAKSWNWSKQWLNTIRPVDVSEHKFNSSFSQRGIANGTGHGTTNWNEQLEYFGLPKDENATTDTGYTINGKPVTAKQAQTRYAVADQEYNDWAPEFYSKMGKSIEEWTDGKGRKMQSNKMGAQQVLGWLKGKGVTDEEIKWSGVVPFLEGKKTVTQEELQQLMAENEVKIETKVLGREVLKEGYYYQGLDPRDGGEREIKDAEALMDYIDELAVDLGYKKGDLEPNLDTFGEYIDVVKADTGELVTSVRYTEPITTDKTRWGSYVLPGGSNYREILFKQPGLNYSNLSMDTHWGEEGVIAHTRIQDMTDYNDVTKRILFVEEVQSDLHNAAAETPFLTTKSSPEMSEYQKLRRKKNRSAEDNTRVKALENELFGELIKKQSDAEKAIPGVEQGNALINATEVLLREAGYDVGFIYLLDWFDGNTNDITTFDHGFSEEPNPIRAVQYLEDNFPDVVAARDRWVAARQEYNKVSQELIAAKDAVVIAPPDVPFAGASNSYHELVMKHLLRLAAEEGYDKIAWTPSEVQIKRWRNEEERGYGVFRAMYDKILVNYMNRYGKQWGAKVGTTTLDNDSPFLAPGEEVWSVDITPEMKESVLKTGQPLFAVGDEESTTSSNPYPENTLEHDFLAVLQNGDPEALGKWVTEQLDANTQAEENAKIRPPVIPTKGFVPRITPQQKEALETKRKGLIQAKGAMKPSEKNANGFQMPKFDENNNRFRRNIQNVGSAEQIPQDAVDQLENFAFTDVAATYVPDSNKVMIEQAKREISQTGDLEKSKAQFQKMARDSYDHTVSAQDIAFGEQLLIETSRSGDTQGFLDTLASLVEISTTAGKTLQAFRMLKQSGPIGQLYYMEKVVDRLNNNLLKRGYNADITIDKDLAQAVLDAETDEDRDKALDVLKADIAKQMPITFKDRIDAWRYLSMLGNFRTHIRNVIGNAIFVPIRFTKDIVAAGNELLLMKAGLMDQQDRTKAVAVGKEWKSFAKEQAEVWKKELQGNGKYNPAREILEARKVLPGFLDALSKINGEYLEKEDWAFLRPAFTRALAMALQNTGYSVEEIRTSNNKEVRQAYNRAIKIAIEEAQKATYRDYSAAASALNRLKRLESDKASGRFFGVLLEGTLPFTKTPINILRRGIEYSPIGLATSIASTIDGAIKHNLDGAQIADSLASGLTGTAVMILGWLLARSGVLRGKRKDDKEEQFEKLQGYQDYSIQWGNQSFTIDWAAPGALPLFTGAALAEVMDEDEDLELADAWDAMMMIAEPMMSLSMLSGLNDVLSSASYADDNQKLMTIGKSMLSSYLGQMFPTIGGQLARSIDGTRRQTYVDKNSKVPTAIQRFVQTSIQNKTPGWESEKAPYVDQWGRQSTANSKVISGMENFFAPWYRSVVNTTDVDEQLQALYDSKDVSDENHKTILPVSPAKSFKVNGEDKYLTADEYVSFATDVGQTKYKLLTSLLSDARYIALTDDQKALAVKHIYDYSTAAGKYHIAPDFNIHRAGKWIEEAEAAKSDYERFEIIWAKIAAAIEK